MFLQYTENILRVLNLPIVSILFLLVVVWVAGELSKRASLPPVLGELLAGLIIGPPILNLVTYTEGLDILAKLGMFFLMFYAGLETDPKKLFKASRPAIFIGIAGTLLPFALGLLVVVGLGGTFLQGMFIGAAISGTSMVTKSRILHDLKLIKTKLGYILMGSAMVDNLLSFIILSVAIKSAMVGELTLYDGVFTLIETSTFFLVSIFMGYKLYPHITKYMRQTTRGFTFAIIVGLFFAFFCGGHEDTFHNRCVPRWVDGERGADRLQALQQNERQVHGHHTGISWAAVHSECCLQRGFFSTARVTHIVYRDTAGRVFGEDSGGLFRCTFKRHGRQGFLYCRSWDE